jgi:PAS domain-containing protein
VFERKQFEERIKKLAERLDLARRSARIGIWDWDIQKDELTWDDQMVALYCIKPDEFGGAYEAWLAGISSNRLGLKISPAPSRISKASGSAW